MSVPITAPTSKRWLALIKILVIANAPYFLAEWSAPRCGIARAGKLGDQLDLLLADDRATA